MKTLKLRIKSQDMFFQDAIDHLKKNLGSPNPDPPLLGTYFESFDAVRSALTPKRLDVWRTIRDHKPDSILELSKKLKRDFKSVHGDVNYLSAIGLVKLQATKGIRGNRKKPKSLADKLTVEVA